MKKITLILFTLLFLFNLKTFAQSYEVKTFIKADGVSGAVKDSDGNLWWSNASSNGHRIYYYDGSTSKWALGATTSGDKGGQGVATRFDNPSKLLIANVAGSEVLLILDKGNKKVKIADISNLAAITVTTLTNATGFINPADMAVDNDGNVYVSDADNYCIYKITPLGVKTVFAGTEGTSGSDNGGATSGATFTRPVGLHFDNDVLYVTDVNKIRKIESNTVSTLSLSPNTDFSDDMEPFYNLGSLVEYKGMFLVADGCTVRAWKKNESEYISLVGGLSARDCREANGIDTTAKFNTVNALYVDGDNFYVASSNELKIVSEISSVSIAKKAANKSVTLYPNPATGSEVFVAGLKSYNTANVTVSIVSLTGKVINTKKYAVNEAAIALNIKDLNKGIYFVQIATGSEIITRRLNIN